jgi:hypothetical protein
MTGVVADRPLYSKPNVCAIKTGALDAAVIPFAQGEMVSTFLRGIDPQLDRDRKVGTEKLFRGIAQAIIEEVKKNNPPYGANLEGKVSPGIDDLLEKMEMEWNQLKQLHFINPVITNVVALPKDELGAMAESLVNLTRFKRRVSTQEETVGGPIDVAVITKGDGFVWTKRKHYFAAELNPRYMAQLGRGRQI